MRINLSIIEESLPYAMLERHYTDEPYDLTCRIALPYQGGPFANDDCVYVCDASRLPDEPVVEGHPSVLCTGMPEKTYLKPPFNTLAVLDSSSANEVLSQTLDVFRQYAVVSDELQALVDRGAHPREMGRIAFRLLENPVFLQGADYRGLFHIVGDFESQPPERKEFYRRFYDGIIPFPENTYYSDKTIGAISTLEDYFALDPGHPLVFSSEKTGLSSLLCNINDDRGNKVVLLSADDLYRKFTRKDIAIMAFLQHYFEELFRRNITDYTKSPHRLDAVLEKTLAGKLLDKEELETAFKHAGWEESDRFFCMAATSDKDNCDAALQAIAGNLNRQFPHSCKTIIDHRLIVLFNISRWNITRHRMLHSLERLLEHASLQAGISNSLDGFASAPLEYHQANLALTLGTKKNPSETLHLYADHNLDVMLRICADRHPARFFLPKGLRLLLDHDNDHGTDLAGFLKTYLDCNMSVTKTVRATYLHKNTCAYRVKQIEKIIQADLSDPRTRMEYNFALALLDAEKSVNLSQGG